jgi:hypothetical protein
MKGKLSVLTLTILLAALGHTPAAAQINAGAYAENIRRECAALGVVAEALEKMPREASRAEDFTPAHWKIESREEADLNGDGRTDFVLSLAVDYKDGFYNERRPQSEQREALVSVPHIVAVLLADAGGGKLKLEAVNYLLEGLSNNPHTFYFGVEKNVIVAEVVYGGGRFPLRHYVFRFRWQKLRFQLIGFDVDNGTDPETRENDFKTSDNFLTGERLETTYAADKTRKGKFTAIVKRFSFTPQIIEFSQARLNDDLDAPY